MLNLMTLTTKLTISSLLFIYVQISVGIHSPIFFVHTSYEPEPSPTELCAIESFSRRHPGSEVHVYSEIWTADSLKSVAPGATVRRLEYDVLFGMVSPTFQHWYKSGAWKVGYQYHHLADAARLALLFLNGGVYSDLDVLLLRPLPSKENAFVGIETNPESTIPLLNNAVLSVPRRHPFAAAAVSEFLHTFDAKRFGSNGPRLVTRVWGALYGNNAASARIQGNINVTQSNNGTLPYFTLAPQNTFYAIGWDSVHELFRRPLSPSKLSETYVDRANMNSIDKLWWMVHVAKLTNSTANTNEASFFDGAMYAVHIWHSLVRGLLPFLASDFSSSLLADVMRAACPSTSSVFFAGHKAYKSRQYRALAISIRFLHPIPGQQFSRDSAVRLDLSIQVGPDDAVAKYLLEGGRQFRDKLNENNNVRNSNLFTVRMCFQMNGKPIEHCLEQNDWGNIWSVADLLGKTLVPSGHHTLIAEICLEHLLKKSTMVCDDPTQISSSTSEKIRRLLEMMPEASASSQERACRDGKAGLRIGKRAVVSFTVDFHGLSSHTHA